MFDAQDPSVRPSDPIEETGDDTTGGVLNDDNGAYAQSEGQQSGARSDRRRATDPPAQTLGPAPARARLGLVGIFFSAVFALASLAAGLWFSQFVSIAVARDDWLGWTAKGLAVLIAALIVLVLVREMVGFFRLARLGRLRRDAEEALAKKDAAAERRVVGRIKHLVGGRAEFRWALARFREQERHRTDAGELLALADTVLLAEADLQARRVIYESARRVAVVTAVVPIAFIAVLFVLFENIRMVRRLAGTYGGRPGLIGGWRLLLRVVFHIAATGAIALTDDLFGQFLGQDMMRRLSARLGEGAFNGALTARLGIVAIELTRPCPHIEAKPLRARHVVAELFPEFSASELMGRVVGGRAASRDGAPKP